MERNSSSPPSPDAEPYLPDLIQLQARIGASSARILRPLDERLQAIRSSGTTEQNQVDFAEQLLDAVVLTYGLVAHASLAVLRVCLGVRFAEHGPFLVAPSFSSGIISRSPRFIGYRSDGPARVQLKFIRTPAWSFDHYQLKNPEGFLSDPSTIDADLNRILLTEALAAEDLGGRSNRLNSVGAIVQESFVSPHLNRERVALLIDDLFFPLLATKPDLYSTTRLFIETSTQKDQKQLHYLLLGMGGSEGGGAHDWRGDVFAGCRVDVAPSIEEIIARYPAEAHTADTRARDVDDNPGLEEYLHYVRLSLLNDPAADMSGSGSSSEEWAARFERGLDKRSYATVQNVVAEALGRPSNLRCQASLSCFEPFVRRSDGGLVIYSGKVLPIDVYHAVYQIVVPALTQIGRIEELAIKYGEAIAGAQAKEQADLLPKWAHGQRGSLFAIGAGLGASHRVMEDAVGGLSPTHTEDVKEAVRNTLAFVEQSHGNIDLLQEIGSYYRNAVRWQEELRILFDGSRRLSSGPLSGAIWAGIRTALIRLLNVPNGEQDQRYINAFARFFQQGLLGRPFVAEAAYRSSPSEIVRQVREEKQMDLVSALAEVQDTTNYISPETLSLLGVPDLTRMAEAMEGLVLPVKAGSAEVARNPVFFAAIRMVVEETVLNYIKHGWVASDIETRPSLSVHWSVDYHPEMEHESVRAVSVSFLNAPRDVQKLLAKNLDEQRSLGSGLLLCHYLLNGLGGAARAFDSTMPVQSWPPYCSPPSWEHWFGFEIKFAAAVAS